jgi:hypothetical protein
VDSAYLRVTYDEIPHLLVYNYKFTSVDAYRLNLENGYMDIYSETLYLGRFYQIFYLMSTIDAENVAGISFVSLSDRVRIKCVESNVYFVNRTRNTIDSYVEFKTTQSNPTGTAYEIQRSPFNTNILDNKYFTNTLFLSSFVSTSIVIDENFTQPINTTGDKIVRRSIRSYKDSIDYRTLQIDFDDDNKITGFTNLPTLDGDSVHHFILRTTVYYGTESYGVSRPVHVSTHQCANSCVN